jgi:hypothetical protein
MDIYENKMVVLDGGLELQQAKLAVQDGRLQDCLNYEVIDRSGYKRIDGFTAFDGREPGAGEGIEDGTVRKVRVELVGGIVPTTFDVGTVMSRLGVPYGYFIYAELVNNSYRVFYQHITGTTEANDGETVQFAGEGDLEAITVASDATVEEVATVGFVNAIDAYRRSLVGSLHATPIGLHWFRDKLYAVVDDEAILFTSGSDEIFPGDVIEDSLGNLADVIAVSDLTSGTWGAGTAAGTLTIHRRTGGFTSGIISIDRPGAGAVADAATIGVGAATADTAGLWVAYNQEQATEEGGTVGWNKVSTGFIVDFEEGDIVDGVFPKIDRRTQEINVEYGVEETDVSGTNGTFTNGYAAFTYSGDAATSADTVVGALDSPTIIYSTVPADLVAVSNTELNGNLVWRATGADTGFTKTTDRIGMVHLNTITEVPGYAVIRGIEVYLDNLSSDAEAAAGEYYANVSLDVSLFKYDATTPTKLGTSKTTTVTNINGAATGSVDLVLGGSTDLWGNTELPLADVLNSNFGVSIRATATLVPGTNSVGGTAGAQALVDRIRVKIHYEKLFTRYYFWNGVDDVQADLVDYRLLDGNLTLGNGEGIMQFTGLEPTGAATRRAISVGDEIHLAAGGVGATKVGVVTAVRANSLPPLAAILEANSRYEFITANFYGNEQWDAFYGVSGAGRAFSFDGNYFVTIYVQNEDDKDIPRHIAYHYNHLALGFRSGTVHLSRNGYPEEFSNETDALAGEDLSFELTVGDRVTGLLSLRGQMLGIFCENSIWGMTGTTRDNFTPNVLAPTTGAIEYTVVDMGIPIYCDNRGISTLSQSEKYGDFQGSRLSAPITSWLLPRLKRSESSTIGVSNAIAIRGKNQYRLFFKDGAVVTMTMVGGELEPQFTFQKYLLGRATMDDREPFVVPIAWSSQADEEGVDRVHFSHYSPDSTVSAADSYFVYELDRGWSFNGQFIPAYFQTSWMYTNPGANFGVRKMILDGLSYGYSNIEVTTARDLSNSFQTTRVICSLPKNAATTLSDEFVPYSTVASLNERGRAISLKFTAVGDGTGDALNNPEPAHVCQVLLLSNNTNLANIV